MLKVKDIMTTDVVMIDGSATVAEGVKKLKENNLHALIVAPRSREDAYGIVTETDIVYKVAAYGKNPTTVKIHEVMTKPCIVVPPSLSVEHAARLFAIHHIQRAPVIQDKLLGIVSVSDIMNQAMWWQG